MLIVYKTVFKGSGRSPIYILVRLLFSAKGSVGVFNKREKMRKVTGLSLRIVFLLVLVLSVAAFNVVPTIALPRFSSSNRVEYWAVIVGIGNYKYRPDLASYSDNDAKDLYEQLLQYPNWQPDHIKLLINSNATLEEINDTMINWLAPLEDENDVVLLYFASHGNHYNSTYLSNSTDYDYYFLSTYDSDMGDYRGPTSTIIAGTWGPTELGHRCELGGWLDKLDSKNIVVIFESCNSGGFINYVSENGRVILASSNASEHDWQYYDLKNSLFTYCILETLENFKLADVNGDRLLSVEEIYNYTMARIEVEIKGGRYEQNPQMQGAGDIILLFRGGITIEQVIFVALISSVVAVTVIFILKRRKPKSSVSISVPVPPPT